MSIETSSEPCPKCGRNYVIGEATCSNCGLVFAKWEQRSQGSSGIGSKRLELAWQEVIPRWNEELAHKSFVDQCMIEHNLPFASLKYRKVLEVDPHSEISKKMQKKIQELVVVSFSSVTNRGLNHTSANLVYSRKPIYAMLTLCAFMVLLGLGMPGGYLASGMPLVIVGILGFVAMQILKRFIS